MLRCSSAGGRVAQGPGRVATVAFPEASIFFDFKESLRVNTVALSGEDPPELESKPEKAQEEASTRAAAQKALAVLLAQDRVRSDSEGPLDRALRRIRTPRPPVTGMKQGL